MTERPTPAWFTENLFPAHHQRFAVTAMLAQRTSAIQKIEVFTNPTFGTVMALDGVVQVTTADEFVYHEMLSCVPLLSHGAVRRALIIGGGDGGTLRHVLRHPGIERATLAEIDGEVIAACRQFLPEVSGGAFDDPRTRLMIGDGAAFVANTAERFDAIMVDCSDPIGPNGTLFTAEFYANCHRCLTPGGVLTFHADSPFMQPELIRNTWRNVAASFPYLRCFTANIPTYFPGLMIFGLASDNQAVVKPEPETVKARFAATGLTCRYYTPELHLAAFVLPRYVAELIPRGKPEQ